MNDRLRTGANARLEVTFNDNSVLTLGENANVAIDRYVYNPAKSTGELALNAPVAPSASQEAALRNCRRKRSPYLRLSPRWPCAAPTSGPAPLMDNMVCSC
jgi:hypothetical protein